MAFDVPAGVLPFCAFTADGGERRLGVGVGTDVVDLTTLTDRVGSVPPQALMTGRLNELLALGRPAWDGLHAELTDLVQDAPRLPQDDVVLRLAFEVADFVDFYSSLDHASNVGRMFRPDAEPLLPNWRHLPVGYHGRAGTVVVDGTPVRRPVGQRLVDGQVVVGPSQRLDVELEVGYLVGGSTAVGEPLSIDDAEDHLFGAVLLNDWSARDIQSWEYVPLGPFGGKSFATSVSAWVVPMSALGAARVPAPVQEPLPAGYLRATHPWTLDLDLELWLRPAGAEQETLLAQVSTADGLYWTPAQQLAHLTVTGASVRPGDLFGTGTVSGPQVGQRGSLLEASWSGQQPVELVGGGTRSFLADGDTVVMRGTAAGVPLGPVCGQVLPAREGRA